MPISFSQTCSSRVTCASHRLSRASNWGRVSECPTKLWASYRIMEYSSSQYMYSVQWFHVSKSHLYRNNDVSRTRRIAKWISQMNACLHIHHSNVCVTVVRSLLSIVVKIVSLSCEHGIKSTLRKWKHIRINFEIGYSTDSNVLWYCSAAAFGISTLAWNSKLSFSYR